MAIKKSHNVFDDTEQPAGAIHVSFSFSFFIFFLAQNNNINKHISHV